MDCSELRPNSPVPQTPDNPVLRAIKDVARSVRFLAAALTFTLSSLFALIVAFQLSDFLLDTLVELWESLREGLASFSVLLFGASSGLGAPAFGVIDALQRAVQAFAVLQLVPAVLICAGLWFIYISAMSKKAPAPHPAGFSLIKGVVIYKIGNGFAFPVAIFVVGLVSSIASEDWSIFGAALFCALLLFVRLFFYYAVLRIVSAVKGSITTGSSSGTASGGITIFVIVMNYIIAISSLFVGLWMAGRMLAVNSLIWAMILFAISMVLFSLVLSKHKKGMLRSANG